MPGLTTDAPRKIITDFAKEISRLKTTGPKPQTAVIDFRDDIRTNRERPVVTVPVELLRYRKDNGRIASDVYTYEKTTKPLEEDKEEDQTILAKFLRDKDPEQTDVLEKSIQLKGQEQPAIITCDGFLINGNRRKMVFEYLKNKTHDPLFDRMKVVILPGLDDEGGPPTIKEIEQIENRYQLQKDGKSEYSNFDRALTIRRKIQAGMSLEEQLRDDPTTAGLSPSEFKKKVEEYKEDYLGPLKCIDEYLESLGRDENYTLISSGIGDKEGKWQAFLDYYNYVYKKLHNERERIKLGIDEDEVWKVQDIAFKLIRFRDFSKLGLKSHALMRGLSKYLANSSAKRELFKLNSVDTDLSKSEVLDGNGNEYKDEEIDKLWINKNRTTIINQVHKAKSLTEGQEAQDTPIELLREALKKLNHGDMSPESVGIAEMEAAMKLAESIEKRAKELKQTFYQYHKDKDVIAERLFKG